MSNFFIIQYQIVENIIFYIRKIKINSSIIVDKFEP